MGIGLLSTAAFDTQAVAAATQRGKELAGVLAKWTALKTKDLATLNATLQQAGLPAVTTVTRNP